MLAAMTIRTDMARNSPSGRLSVIEPTLASPYLR